MRKGAEQEPAHLVAPGDVITRDSGFMRGHGTYMAPGEEVQTRYVPSSSKYLLTVSLNSHCLGVVCKFSGGG